MIFVVSRYVVSRNRSKGICTQTSIALLHVTKVIGFGENAFIRKVNDINANFAGVRNIGLSSNEYLVWLVHLPASESAQVKTLLKSILCMVGYKHV